MMLRSLVSLGFLAAATAAVAQLPLPEHTDIPEDFSTVICPDREAGERMLGYYRIEPTSRERRTDYTIDIPAFFAGLGETGCVQNGPLKSGTIEIERVLARRSLDLAGGPMTPVLFEGRNGDGVALVGIVDEEGNNRFPRTPLEEWLSQRMDGDTFVVGDNPEFESPAYVCASIAEATAVVRAIPDPTDDNEAAATRAFEAALAAQGCRRAPDGAYRVTELGEEEAIYCGYECLYLWTALAAEGPDGEAVGVIYDGSIM